MLIHVTLPSRRGRGHPGRLRCLVATCHRRHLLEVALRRDGVRRWQLSCRLSRSRTLLLSGDAAALEAFLHALIATAPCSIDPHPVDLRNALAQVATAVPRSARSRRDLAGRAHRRVALHRWARPPRTVGAR